jgi:hypothetical protein
MSSGPASDGSRPIRYGRSGLLQPHAPKLFPLARLTRGRQPVSHVPSRLRAYRSPLKRRPLEAAL